MDNMAEEACATAQARDGVALEVQPLPSSTEFPAQVAQAAISFGESAPFANATCQTLMTVTLLCSVVVATLAWLVFLAWLLIQAARLLI